MLSGRLLGSIARQRDSRTASFLLYLKILRLKRTSAEQTVSMPGGKGSVEN